jgi:hypothetical protein
MNDNRVLALVVVVVVVVVLVLLQQHKSNNTRATTLMINTILCIYIKAYKQTCLEIEVLYTK